MTRLVLVALVCLVLVHASSQTRQSHDNLNLLTALDDVAALWSQFGGDSKRSSFTSYDANSFHQPIYKLPDVIYTKENVVGNSNEDALMEVVVGSSGDVYYVEDEKTLCKAFPNGTIAITTQTSPSGTYSNNLALDGVRKVLYAVTGSAVARGSPAWIIAYSATNLELLWTNALYGQACGPLLLHQETGYATVLTFQDLDPHPWTVQAYFGPDSVQASPYPSYQKWKYTFWEEDVSQTCPSFISQDPDGKIYAIIERKDEGKDTTHPTLLSLDGGSGDLRWIRNVSTELSMNGPLSGRQFRVPRVVFDNNIAYGSTILTSDNQLYLSLPQTEQILCTSEASFVVYTTDVDGGSVSRFSSETRQWTYDDFSGFVTGISVMGDKLVVVSLSDVATNRVGVIALNASSGLKLWESTWVASPAFAFPASFDKRGNVLVKDGNDVLYAFGCCSNRGFCNDESDTSRCECDTNYHGNECQYYCDESACRAITQDKGSCSPDTGECVCEDGWFPSGNCSIACDSDWCHEHNAECSSMGECICWPNFYGESCEKFCEPDRICSSNGNCDRTTGDCVCFDGYSGVNCELKKDGNTGLLVATILLAMGMFAMCIVIIGLVYRRQKQREEYIQMEN